MAKRLLLLIVAALVLRAWVGAAMAGEMLAGQAQEAVAAVQVHEGDCAHHMADAATPASGDHTGASCAQCQDCTLAALPARAHAMAQPLPQPAAAEPPFSFASAELVPGVKPPIA